MTYRQVSVVRRVARELAVAVAGGLVLGVAVGWGLGFVVGLVSAAAGWTGLHPALVIGLLTVLAWRGVVLVVELAGGAR
jgi:hypothetical protein